MSGAWGGLGESKFRKKRKARVERGSKDGEHGLKGHY